ncbi:MAG: hypothetical protein WDN10_02520 [bacterium]
MTATTRSFELPHWLGRTAFIAAGFAVSVAAFLFSSLYLLDAYGVSAMEDNAAFWEWTPIWVSAGGVICLSAYALILVWTDDWTGKTRKYFGPLYWFYEATDEAIPITLSVFTLLALMPTAAALYINQGGHLLGTAPGYVRITDDGRMLLPGQIVQAERLEVRSVPVPVWRRSAIVPVTVAWYGGYTIHALVSVDFRLKPNASLQGLLATHYQALGPQETRDRSGMQLNVFTGALAPYLADKIARVLREIEEKKITGSEASMQLRLAALVHEHRTEMPGWVKDLSLGQVVMSDSSFLYH